MSEISTLTIFRVGVFLADKTDKADSQSAQKGVYMKNAVIYARFSSHAQNEQSVEGQLKECYAFAEKQGYKIINEYIDRALTGTTDKRPQFLTMIDDSKRKQFQFVIVYQLDRFARNRYDSATYKSRLKKNGVRVLSAKENITDDASGILIEGVLESMAEYYSVELGQKIKRGMALNAEKCKSLGSGTPFGYKVDSNRNIVLDEEKAPLVVKMYELLASGSNYAEIARYLNERGILTSRGVPWGKSSFKSIFGNRKYLGIYVGGGIEVAGGIPRIIDDQLFEEVQSILSRYAQAPSRGKAKVEYVLSEKLICGRCGWNLSGVSATSSTKVIHHYYQCHSNRTRKGCTRKAIRKQYIEDEIHNSLLESLKDDEWVDIISAETYLLIQAENNDAEIKQLDGKVGENQKSINNLMKILMLGKATDSILAQVEQLENENKELKNTIENERAMRIEYTYADIKKWLLHFRNLDYSKIKNRRDLINTFVYKIILLDDKVKVICHLKGGQDKHELLLNLIFPDYPDGDNNDGGTTKKSDESLSTNDEQVKNSNVGESSYTSPLVEIISFELTTSCVPRKRSTN